MAEEQRNTARPSTTTRQDAVRNMVRGQRNAALPVRAQTALRHPRATTPLILLMGFIGASLRYVLELALPANGGFPFATLIVNIFGCFVLELVNRYIGRRMHLPAPLVKSLGVGLVGAFTTLSAFSTECLSFIHAGKPTLAGLYIAATLATTLLATLAGHVTCCAIEARRMRHLRKQRAARAAKRMRGGDPASGDPASGTPTANSTGGNQTEAGRPQQARASRKASGPANASEHAERSPK